MAVDYITCITFTTLQAEQLLKKTRDVNAKTRYFFADAVKARQKHK
jgi:hypothetical protein